MLSFFKIWSLTAELNWNNHLQNTWPRVSNIYWKFQETCARVLKYLGEWFQTPGCISSIYLKFKQTRSRILKLISMFWNHQASFLKLSIFETGRVFEKAQTKFFKFVAFEAFGRIVWNWAHWNSRPSVLKLSAEWIEFLGWVFWNSAECLKFLSQVFLNSRPTVLIFFLKISMCCFDFFQFFKLLLELWKIKGLAKL